MYQYLFTCDVHVCTHVCTYLETQGQKKVNENRGDDILSKKACNAGPDCEAVNDDNEHPRKDAHCHHLQLRVRVWVVFVALDEVSTTWSPGKAQDGNWEGDLLGGGDGAGAHDDLQLEDGRRTWFSEGFVHPGGSCFVLDSLNQGQVKSVWNSGSVLIASNFKTGLL